MMSDKLSGAQPSVDRHAPAVIKSLFEARTLNLAREECP
jgi:hypothetical protein